MTDFKIHLISASTIAGFVTTLATFVCFEPVAVGFTLCDNDLVAGYEKNFLIYENKTSTSLYGLVIPFVYLKL